MILLDRIVVVPKSSGIEMLIRIIGMEITKNSSSKNRLVNIIAVLRPALIPSLLRNTTMRLLPPTAEGVTADVNSQRILTRIACHQLNVFPDILR